MRNARILACLIDFLVAAACADAVGLAGTGILWRFAPVARGATTWVWIVAGIAAITGFLLRDARGGRARRWLGLTAVGPDGGPPGPGASIRRNLPLLVPGWNLAEVWPLWKDGAAPRWSDQQTGIRIIRTDG